MFTTVPWLTGHRRRSAQHVPATMASPEGAAVQVPARRSKGAAAATDDRFMDIVVLLSVLLFLVLAVGIGLLVLRNTLLAG